MEIVDIFVLVENSLYSVKYDTEEDNTYQALFNRWQDVEYLEQFFEENKKDLQSGFYGSTTVEEAVFKTLDEAAKFDEFIYKVAKRKVIDTEGPLEKVVFTSLHEDVLSHKYIQSKAYGPSKKSWLRLYAIRVDSNLFVVSGGAIKLTEAMTTEHLKKELRKLKATVAYLKEIGFEVREDLGYIEIGNNEAN